MKRLPIYPLLVGVYPVWFLYGSNYGTVPLGVAIYPMLIAACASLMIFGLSVVVYRNRHKGGLFTLLLAALFYSYGHVHSLLYSYVLEYDIDVGGIHHTIFIFKIVLFLAMAFAWLAFAVYGFIRIRDLDHGKLPRVTGAINIASAALLVMPLISIATYEDENEGLGTLRMSEGDNPAVVEELGYLPDIYNIILDGYGREDTLKQFYGYDNADFLRYLEERGFKTSSRATANYYWTFLSLASSRSLSYLDELRQHPDETPRDMSIPFRLIRDSEVSRYLRSHGYRIVHLNSTWGATMTNPYADEEIQCSSGVYQTEFYRVLYETTMLKMWEANVNTQLAECHLNNFDTLEKIAKTQGPKYVFVHFVPPHHPYLFDREGNILRHATVSNQFEFQKYLWQHFDKYLDQLIYVNKRMKGVVDAILRDSEKPPVIIIQSDHGPQLQKEGITMGVFGDNRLSIFFSAYTPGSENLFPVDISSVNIFRYLFNHYFDAGLPILPDEHYYSDYHTPYSFFRVRNPSKK